MRVEEFQNSDICRKRDVSIPKLIEGVDLGQIVDNGRETVLNAVRQFPMPSVFLEVFAVSVDSTYVAAEQSRNISLLGGVYRDAIAQQLRNMKASFVNVRMCHCYPSF